MMKALLTRCGLRRSIGVVIEDRRIAVCILAATPLGHRHVHSAVRDCDGEPPQAVLEGLLRPWIKRGRRRTDPLGPWVQVGMPESQVFQAVVPITSANRNSPPQGYFLEAVQATNLRAEERMIDLVKLELNKRPLACVAAAARNAIDPFFEMMTELGTRIGLVEPTPASLCRAGAFHCKAPHNSKLVVRFVLGREHAIGVMAAGAQPLFWHGFDLPRGDETGAILAGYSTLWMFGRHARISLPVDTVVVHGRSDIALTQDKDAFHKRTGARLLRAGKPDYDLAAMALGLALANPLAEEMGHDLGRCLTPSVCIRDIFPWAQLAFHGALLLAVSLFLLGISAEVNARLKSLRAQMQKVPWLKDQDQAKLDAERKFLEQQSKAIEAFRGTRVDWSVPLRRIAATAPENTIITALAGDAEIQSTSKGAQPRSKKQLILNFVTPMPENGSMPREIDAFVGSVRALPALRRHFPLIEVSGLRADQAKRGSRPYASYSIICLPKVETTKTAAGR
jgi:hypothetical protein